MDHQPRRKKWLLIRGGCYREVADSGGSTVQTAMIFNDTASRVLIYFPELLKTKDKILNWVFSVTFSL